MNERLFGIDRRRPLPTFHRRHFRRWFRDHPRQPAGQSRGKVVLLDDCLTTFCEPRVNQAAVRVLESLGYEVQLAALECCGRALISKGFLAAAKRLAADNVARLVPFVEQGLDVVGCEPSCVLTLADDYLDLVPGPAAERLAARVRLIDGYVLAAGDALPLAARSGSALLHGHCHQKALVGDGDSQRLLERIAGLEVVRVDAGCCGMAGSFGYEHYELSMKIGGRVLFPAIEAAPEATIVAPGFSCRHQIEHGTGRAARHPIELVADQLRR